MSVRKYILLYISFYVSTYLKYFACTPALVTKMSLVVFRILFLLTRRLESRMDINPPHISKIKAK